MSRRFSSIAVILLSFCHFIVIPIATPACATSRAQDSALLPAMRMAWPGVAENVSDGITAALQAGTITEPQAEQERAALQLFGSALEFREKVLVFGLVARWPSVKTRAESGIMAALAAARIGPGVAGSLRERLAKFEEALFQL